MTEIINENRKVSVLLGFGILFIPLIFSWFLLRKGHSSISRIFGFGWLVVTLIIALGGGDTSSDIKSYESMLQSEIRNQSQIENPIDQNNFIEIVENYSNQYQQAENDLLKSKARKQRGIETRAFRNVSNWVGIIEEMATTGEGHAYLSIIIPNTNIKIKTWNNTISDMFSNTLIKNGNALYMTIAEMNDDDVIYFSGYFEKSSTNKLDSIEEGSLTEYGSMISPEFIFHFTNIEKI